MRSSSSHLRFRGGWSVAGKSSKKRIESSVPGILAVSQTPATCDRPHVLVLVETSIAYGRGIVRGIARWLKTHGRWSIYLEQHALHAAPPPWLSRWRGDGVLCRITDPGVARTLRSIGVAVVDLNDLHDDVGFPHVWSDHRGIGRVAAQHLIDRGFRSLAFCGFSDQRWSSLRREGFCGRAAEAGLVVAVHESDWFGPGAPEWEVSQERLRTWLAAFEPPVAVMACNDLRGQHVIDAARRAGRAVPEEVAVIGVDDDELLCELCDPPLSSVCPDPEEVGYRAAALLESLMAAGPAGHGPPTPQVLVPPLGVTVRQSTDILAVADPEVAAALRLIRERACTGITVADIVREVGTSRTRLERRFRALLGSTPQGEIRAAQLKRVRRLLADTDLSLERIAAVAGFTQASYLSHAFKRACGETPGGFRRRRRPG
jgi:LacI family transcriptional regulator